MKLATLCYLKKDGKTLMLHRNNKKNDIHFGKWNGLGGKLKEGETPEECVIREVREESGLIISKPKLMGILTFPNFFNQEDWYVFVYTANEFTGTMINSPEGKLSWIDDEKVTDLNLWEGDKHFLNWFEKYGIFSGKFEYKDKNLIKYDVVFHRS